MTGTTHGAIGLATGIGVIYLVGANSWIDVVATVAISFFASLLPDIDAEESKIQSMFLPKMARKVRSTIYVGIAILLLFLFVLVPSTPFWVLLIGIFFGLVPFVPHRTVTHSLLMVIYLGWIVHQISPELMWPFVAGYLSHLVADVLTVSGIPFFWPLPTKISISKIGIRIKTGSVTDQWVGNAAFVLFFLGLFYLFI